MKEEYLVNLKQPGIESECKSMLCPIYVNICGVVCKMVGANATGRTAWVRGNCLPSSKWVPGTTLGVKSHKERN